MISGQAPMATISVVLGDRFGRIADPLARVGALLPLYRNHSSKGDNVWPDGNQGREPWRFSPANAGFDYCSLMRNNIQFRYQLMPYLYTLMRNAAVGGTPMKYACRVQLLHRREYVFPQRIRFPLW